MTSVIGFVLWIILSVTNALYWSWPTFWISLTDSTTSLGMVSFVSNENKSPLSSLKGFPSSFTTFTRLFTFFKKVVCREGTCSWCFVDSFSRAHCSSYCLTILAIPGPPIIQRLRALGFVSPTAPPSPLMAAFSCSFAWSRAIEENVRLVLLTTKAPD